MRYTAAPVHGRSPSVVPDAHSANRVVRYRLGVERGPHLWRADLLHPRQPQCERLLQHGVEPDERRDAVVTIPGRPLERSAAEPIHCPGGVCRANPGLQTIVTFDDYSANTPAVSAAYLERDLRERNDDRQLDVPPGGADRHGALDCPRACHRGTAITVKPEPASASGSTEVNLVSTNPTSEPHRARGDRRHGRCDRHRLAEHHIAVHGELHECRHRPNRSQALGSRPARTSSP